jgi:FtsP/CotA-like multicopper oxidase with cupredoxin domain
MMMAFLFIGIIIMIYGISGYAIIHANAQPSNLQQMNFSDTEEVFSKEGILKASITAGYHRGNVSDKPITAMVFNNSLVGPTLNVNPGDRIELTLINALNKSTNLHFHGLHVSPSNNSDNIFIEVAPGKTLTYVINLPVDHPPSTFWYHSHMHELSYEQVSAGLSGLIVIQGLEELLPASLHDIKVQTFAMRDFPVTSDPSVSTFRTVNGKVDPEFNITTGETQFWRLANIGSETFYKIAIPGHKFYVVAEDGSPVWDIWDSAELLLPSGKRYDVLVTASENGSYPVKALDYYPYPETTIASMNIHGDVKDSPKSIPKSFTPSKDLGLVKINATRELNFSSNEEVGKYMINDKIFDPNRTDQQVRLGAVEEWKLINLDEDEHPFHIHVNDFQVISVNGKPYEAHGLQDTVVIPGHGEVVIRIPFEDFVGKSVYHCHIMFHGDGGMMGVFEVVS